MGRGCEPLVAVDVADLIGWIGGIDITTWPDWNKGAYRPAVINDPAWEDLTRNTQPVVSKLLALFPGCHDTYRSITTVHPGDYVPPHTDTLCPGWVTRIHVPIITNAHAWFITDNVYHHLKVGMSYKVDPSIPHAIKNDGQASRIHLMFDVVAP